jgi:hypothetical protein
MGAPNSAELCPRRNTTGDCIRPNLRLTRRRTPKSHQVHSSSAEPEQPLAPQLGRPKKGARAPGGLQWSLADGAGDARSWCYRCTIGGRTREMGLGGVSAVTLAQARQLAANAREMVKQGADPLAARAAERAKLAADNAPVMTFDKVRDEFIVSKSDGWKNAKHRQQWTSTLQTYVTPIFGDKDVRGIDTDMVLEALKPI